MFCLLIVQLLWISEDSEGNTPILFICKFRTLLGLKLDYKRFCAKCQPKDFTECLSEHIHYNSHIVRDRKKTFSDRRLSENCVTMVKHLIDEEGNILSFADFQEGFPNMRLDFLTYHRFVSSVMTCQEKNKKIKIGVRTLLPLTQTQNYGQLI